MLQRGGARICTDYAEEEYGEDEIKKGKACGFEQGKNGENGEDRINGINRMNQEWEELVDPYQLLLAGVKRF